MPAWLHVSAGYAPMSGGGEKYIQTISERFVARGDRVTVATTTAAVAEHWWDPRQAHVVAGVTDLNGVRVARARVAHWPLAPYSFFALRRLVGLLPHHPAALSFSNWLGQFLPWVPDFEHMRATHAGSPQLVHASNIIWEGPLLAAARFARQHNLPLVCTPFMHLGVPAVERYYTRPHQIHLLKQSAAVIVQTDLEGAALVGWGVAPERIHRLGMGVDLETLRGGDAERFRTRYAVRGPLITFMGAVTYDKGVHHLTQALTRLWARGIEATLALAGRPIAVGGYDKFFNQLPPTEQARVLRLGEVSGQLKQDLLAATDIFVLPSRVDSFGIVFLEAWAYGAPVIGAAAGGIPGVIDAGRDGLLVPFGDLPQLAEAIERLLADRALARALGAQGRAKVEARYTWERIERDLHAIYLSLLNH